MLVLLIKRVVDCFLENLTFVDRTWNQSLIDQIFFFCLSKATIIIAIPLSRGFPSDVMIWAGKARETYSVRSA
jgi:hypothetical protein